MKKLAFVLSLVFCTLLSTATEINWKSPQEVDKLMSKEPKKVIVDFYTSWCGWCKVMDKNTYSNPKVIDYINKNFYAIKFDAESKESFQFQGTTYSYNPKARAHDWAITFLGGRMSYPTTLFFLENFENPMSVPGYVKTPMLETIMTYIYSEKFKSEDFEDYQESYTPEW